MEKSVLSFFTLFSGLAISKEKLISWDFYDLFTAYQLIHINY